MTNPFAPLPYRTAAAPVSGGGADGHIDHVVGLVLQRVTTQNSRPAAAQADPADVRQFDLAELISQCARAAGIPGRLPLQADALKLHCQSRGTLLPVALALTVNGALLFAPGSVGLSLGARGRVVVFSQRAGIVIDDGLRTWTSGALIPGARGYR